MNIRNIVTQVVAGAAVLLLAATVYGKTTSGRQTSV